LTKENAMRRGRTILIILLVVVVVIVGGVLAFRLLSGTAGGQTEATPTPEVRFVEVIVAGQNISPGPQIEEGSLSTMRIPETDKVEGYITDRNLVVGKFAKIQILQGWPIMTTMLSDTPGISNLPGSPWASQIPSQLTAVAMPISRLNSAAFGIRDNDFVNVIVTMLLVDVDASYQTVLPNYTAAVTGAGAMPDMLPVLTVQIGSGGAASTQGRTELDPTLNNAIYVVPSELQRPRMVTQMIMQNIQVLHVGTFPPPGEATETPVATPGGTTPGSGAQAQQAQVYRPDIITLMVTPQDAVVLTYLVYSGSQITLTLRNPADFEFKTTTDAATLQYLLSQYDITVPAKLPYSLQPRIDALIQPSLPNDVIVSPAQ
jgi:Flp pilus assembly protein CpaB